MPLASPRAHKLGNNKKISSCNTQKKLARSAGVAAATFCAVQFRCLV